MRTDQWLLFGHLVGVIVLFGAVAVENISLIAILRARTTQDLRAATTFTPLLPRMFPAAVVLLLAFGVGLVAHSDEFKFGEAWIDLGFGVLILLAVIGPTVHGRRIDRIRTEARTAPDGPVPVELMTRVQDPVMRTSALVSTWLAIGIVLLMTRQPDWAGAWIVVVVFGLIGLSESMMLSRLGAAASDGPSLR
ncbi:MAG: hypothetical protein ACJ735_10935 [Actinomycetes bacterium]